MVKGKKSALLVGCNYYGTQYQRKGRADDVTIIENVLPTYGFKGGNITKLVETNAPDPRNQPTYENIKKELENMINHAGEGDVLFFYFSGTMKVNDQSNNIPAILCCDLEGLPATEFQRRNPLPKNTLFTLVLESSHNARFIEQLATDEKKILFSACQEKETANRTDHGAFTDAIKTVASRKGITNEEVLRGVNQVIIEQYPQHAGLSCLPPYRNWSFLGYLVPDKA